MQDRKTKKQRRRFSGEPLESRQLLTTTPIWNEPVILQTNINEVIHVDGADISGDGVDDAIAAGPNVLYYMSNRDGTFAEPQELTSDGIGYGMTLAVGGNVRVGVLYYYDADRQPRWALGQTDNAVENTMPMASFSGFCPDCERVDPTFVDAGTVSFRFDSLRMADFRSEVSYPGTAGGSWLREVPDFIPLNDPPEDNSRF